jgi:uncharacterized protein (TIGR00369 family)
MSQLILEKCRRFIASLAHMRKLQMQVIRADEKSVTVVLPVQDQLISSAFDTYMHGGVLTTLVDTATSLSTIPALKEYELCPTLDLRIDHMSTPVASQPLYAFAECYRVTRNVLFTRATIYQENPDKPVAYAISTFMRPGDGNTDASFKAIIDGVAITATTILIEEGV